ncbi:MAG: ATP F0F1 synthase subunit B [Pseudomonadota bacterium]
MRIVTLSSIAAMAAAPAFAASKNPFSAEFYKLSNTDFIVLLGFITFLLILAYFKVPALIVGMLDKRATDIQAELDEARKLREEAQEVLASYERKLRDVQGQADQIVTHAKTEAREATNQAKLQIESSIERRLQAAQDKIASAEASALREVRDRAADIAVAAAAEVIASSMSDADRGRMIDDAIGTVDTKLH